MSTLDAFRMDDRTAVVTGASSGLGAGFARSLASAGANLVLAARRGDRLQELADELRSLGVSVAVVTSDVSLPEDCERIAETATEHFGRIDALINNAGLGSAVPAFKETAEGFRSLIDVNLNGAFWMARAAAARMEHGGAIVNVASILGQVAPRFPQAAYAASKAGLIGLTRDLAGEWARRDIRVNALCPGYFASEMTAAGHGAIEEVVVEHSMMRRFGEQHELDTAMLFLASPASSYVTGTTLTVDGGMTSF